MTIDWDKPLECEHGEVKYLLAAEKHHGRTIHWVGMGSSKISGLLSAHWHVYEDGTPIDGWMPRVYNAKRKPKEGEWWMCRTVGDAERPLIKSESVWVSSIGNWYKVVNVEPLYPLIKDPDF